MFDILFWDRIENGETIFIGRHASHHRIEIGFNTDKRTLYGISSNLIIT